MTYGRGSHITLACSRVVITIKPIVSPLLGESIFRKDSKNFAAISVRRRKKNKGKCSPSFLNEN